MPEARTWGFKQFWNSLKQREAAINPDMKIYARCLRFAVIASALLPFSIPYPAQAQQISQEPVASAKALPEAPEPAFPQQPNAGPQQQQTSPQSQEDGAGGRQTKRILGILPNFRAVSADTHLPPQSPREKFVGFAQDSFDYSGFILAGMVAGVGQIQGSVPEFGSGFPAYGRYYWHSFVDSTSENFWVEFALPVALHQDARYYTLGNRNRVKNHGDGCPSPDASADAAPAAGNCVQYKHNGIVKRAGYALSRVLVTRSDKGGNEFNYSEVVGSGAAAGLSNFYYPASNRGWNKTGQRWALNIGIDGASFVAKEFWPDINHAIFHIKQ